MQNVQNSPNVSSLAESRRENDHIARRDTTKQNILLSCVGSVDVIKITITLPLHSCHLIQMLGLLVNITMLS